MLIPKTLTLISTAVAVLLALVFIWTAWRHRNPLTTVESLSEVSRKANRWLVALRVCLLLAIGAALSAHSYWVFWADSNERFAKAKAFDLRNRRLADSALKGWVLDRTEKLENALIRYRADGGVVTREYPLGQAAVHLTGYSDFVFGSGGIEYAYRKLLTEPASVHNSLMSPVPVGTDLTISVDAALQRDLFNLLLRTGKPAAAAVLAVPENEVLAMASTPSFDPLVIRDERRWRDLTWQANQAPQLSPLVNRSLGTFVTGGPAYYYRPGSTFKTFVASVAIDSGVTEEKFTCRAEGFTPRGVSRPIRDFEGEVHGVIGLDDAFRLSCNQYFAQLGILLGRERLANYARRLGFATMPDEQKSWMGSPWRVREGSEKDLEFVFAPPVSRMNLSAQATDYDIALQSFGQGYDDVSVIQMAVLAAIAAGPDGSYSPPTLEHGGERKVARPFVSAQTVARLRRMMRSVVEKGTAADAFRSLSKRITAGGKTGTADRTVPVYGRDGKQVVERLDEQGRPVYKFENRTDSWFVGFAPADEPRIAYAVIVENGGPGARAAAPLAAKLVERAAALGHLAPQSSGKRP
jgi:cell division protein FtsI/penicillin-binding protein 2